MACHWWKGGCVWEEIGRHFTGRELGALNGFTQDELERLRWGVTMILLQCPRCGSMKSMEIKGDARTDEQKAAAPAKGEKDGE